MTSIHFITLSIKCENWKHNFSDYLVSKEDSADGNSGHASELLTSSVVPGPNSNSSVKAVAMERASNGFDTVCKQATI